MASTTRSLRQQTLERSPPLRWRRWPLLDYAPWSSLSILALLALGGGVYWIGGGWVLTIAAPVGLAVTFWTFFLPAEYEIATLGIRRRVLGRTRLLPWHSIRSYQPRSGGILLYQNSDPSPVDLLRSVYLPYPDDADELLCAIRPQLSHAMEL